MNDPEPNNDAYNEILNKNTTDVINDVLKERSVAVTDVDMSLLRAAVQAAFELAYAGGYEHGYENGLIYGRCQGL